MRIHELVRKMLDMALDDVHTALPARVEKYDPTTLRGEVVPLVKRRVKNDGEPEPLPPILDVPFWMPKAGPFVLRLPVRRGDTVLVVFSERALDYLLLDGQPQDPRFRRRHALDDAIAIPGLLHMGEGGLPSDHDGDVLLLHRDVGAKMVMYDDGAVMVENPDAAARMQMAANGEFTLQVPPHVVRLVPGGPAIIESPDVRLGGEDADEGVPLGRQLKQWLDSHTHSHSHGPTGPPQSPSPEPSGTVFTK